MPNNDTSTEDRLIPAAKKPYEKPSFRYEKVFVTSALSCGKIGITSTFCSSNQKVS
jgi:hypothetical protein